MHIREYIEKERVRLGRMPRLGFLGLGVSNTALIEAVCDMHLDITLRQNSPIDRAYIAGYAPSRIFEGERALDMIDEDILILSPSVRRDSASLLSAKERGTILTSDIELFLADAEGVYAVTGSSGKSTTATIAHRLIAKEQDTAICGNIGTPFMTVGEHRKYIAEISSFQAMYIDTPTERAVLTSLSPNHLDWHTSLSEYTDAKLNLVRRAAYSAMSADDELCREYLSVASADSIYSIKYDYAYLRSRYKAKNYITLEGDNILLSGDPIARLGSVRPLWYNIANLLGAIALTLGDFTQDGLGAVIEDMPCLRHRAELFYTHRGVDYINSSIDTTPERTEATLTAIDRRVSIIIGGRGKGLSIKPLIPTLARYAVRISLYGEAGAEYYPDLAVSEALSGIPCQLFEKFDDATEHAIEGATEGVAVLLSPAATGYGEFKSFAERGEHFMQFIKEKYKEST